MRLLVSMSLVASTLTVLQVASVVVAPAAAAANLSDGSVTTLAGSGANTTAAGTGATASFATPEALTYTGGAVYVADADAIAKVVTSNGATTVLTTAVAGGSSMATDGANVYTVKYGSSSLFKTVISSGATTSLAVLPAAAQAVAWYSSYLYVTAGNVVYKQNPGTGAFTTVATFPSTESVWGVAADGSGNLFVLGNNSSTGVVRIAKVVISTGVISTVSTDANLRAAPLSQLFFMGGYLYPGADNSYLLRRYSATSGVMSLTAGSGSSAHADGTGAKAWFNSVNAVAGDATNLFVADSSHGTGNYVRKVAPGTALGDAQPATVATAVAVPYGTVTTLSGNGLQGTVAGTGGATGTASYNYPLGITYLNGSLYVGDADAIMKVNPATGAATVVAGIPGGSGPSAGLLGTSVGMSYPEAMVTDGTFIYGTENPSRAVFRFDPVTTAVSIIGSFPDSAWQYMTLGPDKALYATYGTYVDRLSLVDGTTSRFVTLPTSGYGQLTGIAADATYLYVVGDVLDVPTGNTYEQIYKVNVSTGTWTVGQPNSRLHGGPMAIAGGMLYLIGQSDGLMSDDPATGLVTTVAGGNGGGYVDATGSNAKFFGLWQVVSDGTSLYATDQFNHRVRKLRAMHPGIPVEETYGTALMDLSGADGDDDAGSLSTSLDGMQSLTAGRADPVNSATGAFTRQETDLTWPGAGTTLNFTRTYTSVNPATGRLGTGWTDPYQASLTFDGSGNATFVSEDGATLVYPKSGSTYTAPPGAPVLAAVSGGYTITTFDQRVTTFNATGQLTKAVDAHGKGLTFGYTGSQQTSITDNAGRTLTLGYTGSLLTSLTLPDGRHVDYGYTGIVLTSVRNLGGHTTYLNYDSHGWLATEIDALTNTLFTNTYDPSSGRVTQQVNGTGQTTTFGWTPGADAGTGTATTTNPDGGVTTDVYNKYVLVQCTDPAGGLTKNSYDSTGNLIEVDDPLGRVTIMTYDTGHNMLTKTLNSTLTTRWTYNALNEPLTQTDPLLHTTTWTYNAVGDKLSQADAMSPAALTTWTYNTDGTVATMVDPRGNASGGTPSAFTTSYGYDAAANQTSVTTPLGEKTGYGYDSNGRQTSVVDPRGYVNPNTPAQYTTSTTFYDNNLPDVVTDPLGHVTTSAYNELDQLTSVTNDSGKVTSFSYDGLGDRLTVTDPLLHTTTTTYDYAGRVTSVTDADGNKSSTTYDTRGNKSTVVDPRGNVAGATVADYTTTFGYDADSEPTTVSHPLPGGVTATTTTNYDSYGRAVKVTDPLGHYTLTNYDNGNRLSSTVDANNHTTTYPSYDNDNRLLQISDPLSQVTNYGYDLDGHLTSRSDPLTRTTSYTFDNDGRQATKVSPGSPALTTTSGYDAAGHLTSVQFSDGVTPNIGYGYDAAGRRTTMTDGTGTTTTVFDNLNRVASVTDGASHLVGYGYDDADRLTTLTYPGARPVTYGYLNSDRLHTIGDWLGHTTTITDDPAGNMTSLAYPNTVTDSRTYDIGSRLTGISDVKAGPSTLATFGYGYDAAGNLTTDNTTLTGQAADNRTYTYTNANQIKTTPQGTFTDDKANQLKAAPASSGTSTTSNYDPAGQLTTTVKGSVTTTYAFNARGDRTSATPSTGTAVSTGFNQRDQLTAWTKGASTVGYTYNGDGLRMSATTGGTTKTYTWDQTASLPMLLDDGTTTFLYAGSMPVEQVTDVSSTVTYLLGDHLGSTRLITDPTGVTTGSYKYDAYGNPTHTNTGATQLQFAGQYTDPTTGWQYLRARDYDPQCGQFPSVDPSQDSTRSAYAYVGNDPIGRTDPTGLHYVTDGSGGTPRRQAGSTKASTAQTTAYSGTLVDCPQNPLLTQSGSPKGHLKVCVPTGHATTRTPHGHPGFRSGPGKQPAVTDDGVDTPNSAGAACGSYSGLCTMTDYANKYITGYIVKAGSYCLQGVVGASAAKALEGGASKLPSLGAAARGAAMGAKDGNPIGLAVSCAAGGAIEKGASWLFGKANG